VAISERVDYTKSYNTLFFSLFQRRVPVVYKTLSVLDVIAVKDSLSTVVVKTVPASDYIGFDSVTYTKSYSPLFFSILRRKTPIVYKTLGVLDAVSVKDDASYVKSYSPLFFLLLQVAIPVRYLTLDVTDVLAVSESASVGKSSVVSASDYIVYDYVPSMSPSDVRYRSLYANVGMRTISVFDNIAPYESVRIVPRAVHAYDVVKVWENVNIVRL
jgi:hypothetical protein